MLAAAGLAAFATGVVGASSAGAAPPMQSISEAAPQPASIGFANMDIARS